MWPCKAAVVTENSRRDGAKSFPCPGSNILRFLNLAVGRCVRAVVESKARDGAASNGANDVRRHWSLPLPAANNARLVVLVADIVVWEM
jgi:hypothetical protein